MRQIEILEYNTSDFLECYVATNTPVVLKTAIDDWKAMSSWNIEYLAYTVGDFPLNLRKSTSCYYPDLSGFVKTTSRKSCLTELYELLKDGEFKYFMGGDLPNLFCGVAMHPGLVALRSDVTLLDFVQQEYIDICGLWVSSNDVSSWLHCDKNGGHNFNAQITGSKHAILVPPTDTKHCYMFSRFANVSSTFSRANIREPDYDRYPRLRYVSCYETVINAGEALYIPPHWLHSFKHIGDTNINFNFWWHDHRENREHTTKSLTTDSR